MPSNTHFYFAKPHFRSRSDRIFLSLEYSTLRLRSKSMVFSPGFAALEAIFPGIRRQIWVKYSRFLGESEV